MHTIEPVTVEELRLLLHYDPESGALTWRKRENKKAWSTRNAGRRALQTLHSEGYLLGKIRGRRVYAHRVAFALYHGRWPAGLIDHINGNRADNRIANLREVTSADNTKNRRAGLPRSGVSGILWIEGAEKWRVMRWRAGRRHNIGSFHHLDEAVAALKRFDES